MYNVVDKEFVQHIGWCEMSCRIASLRIPYTASMKREIYYTCNFLMFNKLSSQLARWNATVITKLGIQHYIFVANYHSKIFLQTRRG